jgi:hypothetical protein
MIISVDEAKSFLEIEPSVTTYDTIVGNLIKYVSDRFQLYLNRKLLKESRTDYFTAGKQRYYVDAYPIDATITPTVMLDDNEQVINDDYYVWYDSGLFDFDFKTSYIKPKQLSITWTGGYPATSTVIGGSSENILLEVPDSIKYACTLQVAFMFRRRRDVGLSSVSMPDGSINTITPTDLLPEVKKILNHYRKAPMEK